MTRGMRKHAERVRWKKKNYRAGQQDKEGRHADALHEKTTRHADQRVSVMEEEARDGAKMFTTSV